MKRGSDSRSFAARVVGVVKTISRGSVMTYGQVAAAAGSPRAARAVGNILRGNFDPAVPCHRVIRSDGSLGGYNRGEKMKRKLLEEESRKAGKPVSKRSEKNH